MIQKRKQLGFLLCYFFLICQSTKTLGEEALDFYSLGKKYLKELYFNQEEIKSPRFLEQLEVCQKAYSTQKASSIKCLLQKINDPYTRILSPQKAEIERKQIETIKLRTGLILDLLDYTLIDEVNEPSPAFEAGVQAKDQITAINDIPVTYLSEKELFYLLEGSQEPKIKLSLKRAYDYFEINLNKIPLKSKSLRQKIFQIPQKKGSQEVLYLKIDDLLSKKASTELAQALIDAQKKDKQVKNLILDLRDNKGGLLENAIEIADLFLEEGQIILKIKNAWGEKIIKAKKEAIYKEKLVVLINQDTASSSEIIAGALQDNQRARLIGDKSFGKGFVQRVRELPDGSLMHITVGKFFTPTNQEIDKVGILPEIQVSSHQAQLSRASDYFSEEAK